MQSMLKPGTGTRQHAKAALTEWHTQQSCWRTQLISSAIGKAAPVGQVQGLPAVIVTRVGLEPLLEHLQARIESISLCRIFALRSMTQVLFDQAPA